MFKQRMSGCENLGYRKAKGKRKESEMKLFRGFVPTKNKSCTMKFKGNADLLTFEAAEALDEYAGILAEDVVLIDVDDGSQAETLMTIVESLDIDCQVIQTTRGKHFYFSNVDASGNHVVQSCGNGKRLACGLTADIKAGVKNSYAVRKFDGKTRFIEWDTDGGEYQTIPAFMRPMPSAPDFANMDAGAGRNNALFSYILTLQSQGFTVDECRQTLNIINRWVLPDPLPDDEIEKILRDDSFKKEIFFVKGKFQFDVFANFIMNRHHIIRVNGQLHIYECGIYTPDEQAIARVMVKYIKNLRDADRNEVLKYLRIVAPERTHFAAANKIVFENGVYDIETDTMADFSPDIILTNKIPWKYVPGAYNAVTDATIDKMSCCDHDIRALLEECIGYTFYRRNELGKSFILIGEGSNGKSVFLDMLQNVLGQSNVSSLDLAELSSRFSTALLFGRLANIGDDIGNDFVRGNEVAQFKKIVSGSRVKAERKGLDPFEFNPYVKMLFSANEIPRMKDKSNGLMRRLVIIPFNAVFSRSDADFDPFIVYKLREQTSMEYLVALGVAGLKRVLERQAFTESVSVTEAIAQYERENNPIVAFCEDYDGDVAHESTVDVYRQYTVFCAENGFNPLSASVFTREICRHFALVVKQKRIDGKRVRVYEIG